MNKKLIFPILIGMLSLSSCGIIELFPPDTESESTTESEGNDTDVETESGGNSESNTDTETESGGSSDSNEEEPSDLYDVFYNHSNQVDIKLDFTNQAIYKLAKYSEDPVKKEMYHPVDVTITINGKEYFYEECGARMKGNTSRNPNFVNERGDIQALVHFKISFNQTFDDAEDNDYYIRTWESKDARSERKDRRFCGAKKFDIKYNKNEDYTFTRQIYAYHVFKEEGLVAQRNNLVKVNIYSETDKMTQLYELQECIDSEFLERRYNIPAGFFPL